MAGHPETAQRLLKMARRMQEAGGDATETPAAPAAEPAPTKYETVTCQVTYTGTTDAALDDAGRAALAVVKSYRTDDPFTGGANCNALADIGTSDEVSRWSLNALSSGSVDQSSTAGDATADPVVLGSSSVNCNVSSDRTAAAAGFEFKVGDTLTVNSGYIIKDSADALNSVYRLDGAADSITVEEFASTLVASASIAVAALIAF